ncbi:integrase, catalytic region, zinc finger, CCHC-type containing protein [Tanacetum coccineum]
MFCQKQSLYRLHLTNKKLLKQTKMTKSYFSVRRPSNKDSSFKNSVLSNTKKSSEKVVVAVRTNKKTDVTSKNVVSTKRLNYKLNVHSKVRRALFTTPRIAKSTFVDTTPVVLKTGFSVKTTQSKSLDTTPVVYKTKIAVVTHLSAKNKVAENLMWIVDNGCSKHMTGDRSLLENFIEKFMGTVRFGNDHFALIIGYGDYVQGNITICYVYYVEGLGHNLFSVGQFCDGARESNLYTISILDMAASLPICFMSKATSTKSWLWHRRLSHLNFGTINDLTKHDLVDGLLKLKYSKELLWAEAISTACFTQNRSIIHPRYNKTPYELFYGRKPNVEYFHVFSLLCYPTNDRDDLGKMKPKADIGIFIGYSETSRGF